MNLHKKDDCKTSVFMKKHGFEKGGPVEGPSDFDVKLVQQLSLQFFLCAVGLKSCIQLSLTFVSYNSVIFRKLGTLLDVIYDS